MDFSDIKVIVFDFDETLYYHPDALKYYVKFIKDAICNLSDNGEDEAMAIIKRFGFDKRGEKRVSFGKTCETFGVKASDWERYKITHYFDVDAKDAQTVNADLLRRLSKKYKTVILSNELLENIVCKARKLNIDLDTFDKIYAPCVKDGVFAISKKETYKKIIEEYGVLPRNVLAIGDRYQVDIAPLAELGGRGVQIENTLQIDELIKNELLP